MQHFERSVGGCTLNEAGRKVFVAAWEARLAETIQHRALGRAVSYKHLLRLECYKLCKHLMHLEPYQPFRAWW